MLISLSEILSKENTEQEKEVPFERKEISFELGTFSIVNPTPVKLRLENTGNKQLIVQGSVELQVPIPCDRCLEEVMTDFSLSFQRELDMNLSEEEREKVLEESNFLIGNELDADQLVINELILNWPSKTLCREDCKGICSHCGINLNESSCDCDTVPLDPRMAAIRDIFEQNQK